MYSKCILLNKEQDDFQSSNLLEVDNIPLPAMRSIFDASFTWRRLQVTRCAYHFISVIESSWIFIYLFSMESNIENSLSCFLSGVFLNVPNINLSCIASPVQRTMAVDIYFS